MNKKIKKYVDLLVSSDEKTLKKIDEYEKLEKFNEHLDSNPEDYIPVDEKFEYIPKNIFKRIGWALKRFFFLRPFAKAANKTLQTVVTGRENIKGIDSAIVVSNHVNKLDSLAIQFALRPKKVYFTAAEFNNMNGFLGDMMRANRMLPMSSNIQAQKNFLGAVKKILKSKKYINFFPERAEWWCYEKPRPQLSGAYKIATKNNVPIIPIFITFNQTEESKKSPLGLKQFVVNILKPIYPKQDLSLNENIEWMKNECQKQWQDKYDSFYNTKK